MICPIGTEAFISLIGIAGSHQYSFTPAPGVELVGDIPSDCSFVSDSYQCDPGFVTARFTATGDGSVCNTDNDNVDCSIPATGEAHGICPGKGECATGPEAIPTSPTTKFSALVTTTVRGNIYAPSIEWSCRLSSSCTAAAPPEDTADCVLSKLPNMTAYAENIQGLATSECHEIVLEHGSALHGDGSCNILDTDLSCGGVLYRFQGAYDETNWLFC